MRGGRRRSRRLRARLVQLPQRRLGAVFAELELVRIGRLWPRRRRCTSRRLGLFSFDRIDRARVELLASPKMRDTPRSDPQPPAAF